MFFLLNNFANILVFWLGVCHKAYVGGMALMTQIPRSGSQNDNTVPSISGARSPSAPFTVHSVKL